MSQGIEIYGDSGNVIISSTQHAYQALATYTAAAGTSLVFNLKEGYQRYNDIRWVLTATSAAVNKDPLLHTVTRVVGTFTLTPSTSIYNPTIVEREANASLVAEAVALAVGDSVFSQYINTVHEPHPTEARYYADIARNTILADNTLNGYDEVYARLPIDDTADSLTAYTKAFAESPYDKTSFATEASSTANGVVDGIPIQSASVGTMCVVIGR